MSNVEIKVAQEDVENAQALPTSYLNPRAIGRVAQALSEAQYELGGVAAKRKALRDQLKNVSGVDRATVEKLGTELIQHQVTEGRLRNYVNGLTRAITFYDAAINLQDPDKRKDLMDRAGKHLIDATLINRAKINVPENPPPTKITTIKGPSNFRDLRSYIPETQRVPNINQVQQLMGLTNMPVIVAAKTSEINTVVPDAKEVESPTPETTVDTQKTADEIVKKADEIAKELEPIKEPTPNMLPILIVVIFLGWLLFR